MEVSAGKLDGMQRVELKQHTAEEKGIAIEKVDQEN
jgi:hypothetical protein